MAKKKATKKANKAVADQSVSEQQNMIAALQALTQMEGWTFIVRNLEANIKVLEQQILDKTDYAGKSLDDAEVDRLRDKRGYLQNLLDTPTRLIAQAQLQSATPIEDLDPYYDSAKEMHADAMSGMREQIGETVL